MTDEPVTDHLTPDVLVDLLEGAPVEASRRQHLDACRECREELRSVTETLALVRADAPLAEPAPAPARRRAPLPSWAAGAAAIVVASLVWYWASMHRAPHPLEVATFEELLPPVELDDDFQLLLALSDASDADLSDIADATLGSSELDAEGWTPDERQRFLEKLAEEMRSSS